MTHSLSFYLFLVLITFGCKKENSFAAGGDHAAGTSSDTLIYFTPSAWSGKTNTWLANLMVSGPGTTNADSSFILGSYAGFSTGLYWYGNPVFQNNVGTIKFNGHVLKTTIDSINGIFHYSDTTLNPSFQTCTWDVQGSTQFAGFTVTNVKPFPVIANQASLIPDTIHVRSGLDILFTTITNSDSVTIYIERNNANAFSASTFSGALPVAHFSSSMLSALVSGIPTGSAVGGKITVVADAYAYLVRGASSLLFAKRNYIEKQVWFKN